MYIITVKIPKNPDHPTALRCKHPKIGRFIEEGVGDHCAFMECANYREKCPSHAIARTGDTCTREKTTGQCPVGIGQCTDVTGEHHSYIDKDAKTIDEARANALALGAHITRIEELHPIR